MQKSNNYKSLAELRYELKRNNNTIVNNIIPDKKTKNIKRNKLTNLIKFTNKTFNSGIKFNPNCWETFRCSIAVTMPVSPPAANRSVRPALSVQWDSLLQYLGSVGPSDPPE